LLPALRLTIWRVQRVQRYTARMKHVGNDGTVGKCNAFWSIARFQNNGYSHMHNLFKIRSNPKVGPIFLVVILSDVNLVTFYTMIPFTWEKRAH